MQVKILEESITMPDSTYVRGEIREVSAERGKLFVENGLAEDVDGKMATGPRPTKPVQIQAAGLSQTQQ